MEFTGVLCKSLWIDWEKQKLEWGHLGEFQWLWDSPATESCWDALPPQLKGTDDPAFTGIQILFLAQLHRSFITRVRSRQVLRGHQKPEKHHWEWELMVLDVRWRNVTLRTGKGISSGVTTIDGQDRSYSRFMVQFEWLQRAPRRARLIG